MKREKSRILTINREEVVFIRKNIKNIYIAVDKTTGQVKISTPWMTSASNVKEVFNKKKKWIDLAKERVCKRNFKKKEVDLSLECYLFGEKYPIKVSQGEKDSVCKNKEVINVYLQSSSCQESLQKAFDNWYKDNLSNYLKNNKEKWEKIVGESAKEWRIRNMKTRWGSCNTKDKRIWLSLSLAKEKPVFIDYIIVHELTHFIEHGHNKNFYLLLDKFYPTWREFRRKKSIDMF